MESGITQNAKELAFLLAETQKHADSFSGDAGEITYLFFVAELSIADISEICELPASEVNRTISDFLVGLFTKSKRFREFLSRPSAIAEQTDEISAGQYSVAAELQEGKADSLIAICKTPDSLGDRVRGMVGTAIRIGMPAASTNITPESVSKMGISAKLHTSQLVKYVSNLENENFCPCCKIRKVAGTPVIPAAETCSPGTVIVERGTEKVNIRFDIALEKIPDTEQKVSPKYAIAFHDLPSWATPVSFSFVGPDHWGNIKEYELPSDLRRGRLCFWVENEEQEKFFVDRTKTCICFDISDPS